MFPELRNRLDEQVSLSLSDRWRLRVKAVEFALSLPMEKVAMRLCPGVHSDPWLPGEREKRVIFTHVPKSAGSSIVQALFDQKSRHVPIGRYAAYDEERFRECFKFTFVRNPWSRIHSAYHYLLQRVGIGDKFFDWKWASHYLADTPSFEAFVLRLQDRRYRSDIKRYVHFRDQLDWISIPGKGNVMDYVGRFERLESDFTDACRAMGLAETPELPTLRPGSGANYRDAYTDQMVSIVGELYKRDVAELGYEF